MYIKDHIVRIENIKTLHALDAVNINHKVIALFMTCEGIPLKEFEVSAILNSFDSLGSKKIPSKKVQALLKAKQLSEDHDTFPCPV